MSSPLDRRQQQMSLAGLQAPDEAATLAHFTGGKVEDYTGARILRESPAVYAEIVGSLAAGVPVAQISRDTGISRNTIAGIWREESRGKTLEQMREHHANMLRRLAMLATDAATDILLRDGSNLSARDLGALAMTITQATDKAELMSGNATSRVEHVAAPTDDDYEHALRRAKTITVEAADTGILGSAAGHCRGGELDQDARALEIGTGDAGQRPALGVPSVSVSEHFDNSTLISNDLRNVVPLSGADRSAQAVADQAGTGGGEGVGRDAGAIGCDGYVVGEFQTLPVKETP